MNDKRFLTPKEVAEKLGINDNQLLDQARKGNVPGRQFTKGGPWKFDPVEIETWINGEGEVELDVKKSPLGGMVVTLKR